jgi:hypothetical protein
VPCRSPALRRTQHRAQPLDPPPRLLRRSGKAGTRRRSPSQVAQKIREGRDQTSEACAGPTNRFGLPGAENGPSAATRHHLAGGLAPLSDPPPRLLRRSGKAGTRRARPTQARPTGSGFPGRRMDLAQPLGITSLAALPRSSGATCGIRTNTGPRLGAGPADSSRPQAQRLSALR